MKSTSESKYRILLLMRILLENTDEQHPMGVAQMADKLASLGIEAERRTLYDDIQTLERFGLDIVHRKDKTYGYFVGERSFELAELKLLADAVQSSKYITYKKTNELIKKLTSLASIYQAGQLNRQLYISDKAKSMNEAIYINIDAVHNAISADKKLRFKYTEYGSDKKLHLKRGGEDYIVSPYLLTSADDNYYMVGYYEHRGILSHFRVDKMQSPELLEEKRVLSNEKLDATEYVLRNFSMFGGELTRVEMRFAQRLIGVVIDRFGKDIYVLHDDGEHFRVRADINVSNAFLGWIMQFGTDAEIISPHEVCERIGKLASNVAGMYKK